jgi:DNA repair protein RadC
VFRRVPLGLPHPREVFRPAIIAAASAVIAMHNHPSGESTPSAADSKVTRDLIRAGQLLKMELIDHVVIGNGNFSSLRALGYFTNSRRVSVKVSVKAPKS